MKMLCTIEWKVRFANLIGNIKCLAGKVGPNKAILPAVPHFVLDEMLATLLRTISQSSRFPQVELVRDAIAEHERECQYRLVNCVDLACQQR